MSEAAAINHSPDFTSMRRWERYNVNVPIRVIVSRAMKASIFDGRGTSLSEGGMALFAGRGIAAGRPCSSRIHSALFIASDKGGLPESAIAPVITMGWSFWISTMPKDKAWPSSASICRALPSWPEGVPWIIRMGRQEWSAGQRGSTQHLQPLRGRVNQFLFGLEHRTAFLLGEDSDGFSHAPAGSAEHLQAIDRRHQQGYAVVTHHAHALGKPVEGRSSNPAR